MTTKWWVGMRRTLDQTTEVTVWAETEEEARQQALEMASDAEWMEPQAGEPAVKYTEVAPPPPKPRSPTK